MSLEANDLLLQRYKIMSIIGKGGMGEVYKAFDENTRRYVAVKTFRINDMSFSSARLQRQVEILSNLKHPNIIALYDIGFFDGVYFIIQEYIEGIPLNNLIISKKLSFEDVVNYSKDILKSLAYLHDNNIIHRDIKPSNIIINQKLKKLYITDFDISKFIDNTDKSLITTTQTGFFIGTPAFAAPEQIENREISDKIDVYSSGIIIYEMLTGKLPFDYKNMKDIYSRLNKSYEVEFKGIFEIEELGKLINRMLSLKAQDRPSAKEALEALNNLYTDTNLQDININEYKDIKGRVVDSERDDVFKLYHHRKILFHL